MMMVVMVVVMVMVAVDVVQVVVESLCILLLMFVVESLCAKSTLVCALQITSGVLLALQTQTYRGERGVGSIC